ncbi:unnamed protein product [Arctia plantaginis]|uniref:Uncharacterized protein n=1 Tax=Arctia plantaginis TaxID=874455 RepID=A0A8S0ZU74_ARCPL|nr:unnamed protein product [Arctia plantaginis]
MCAASTRLGLVEKSRLRCTAADMRAARRALCAAGPRAGGRGRGACAGMPGRGRQTRRDGGPRQPLEERGAP